MNGNIQQKFTKRRLFEKFLFNLHKNFKTLKKIFQALNFSKILKI